MNSRTGRYIAVVLTFSLMGMLVNCGPSNPDNTREPSSENDGRTETEAKQNTSETDRESSEAGEQERTTSGNVAASKPTLVYYQMPG